MKNRVSTKNKILIGVIIGIYSLALLVLASIILEGAGTFVGEWLNRPSVDSYMKKNYKGLGYKVADTYFKYETEENYGFNIKTKGYIYECKVTSVPEGRYGSLSVGDRFLIKSYNFKVYYDQIFSEYNCDLELSSAINDRYLQKLKEFFKGEDYKFEPFAVYADTMPSYNEFKYGSMERNVDAAINSGIIGRGTAVLHVRGEKVGFDEYRRSISYIVDFCSSSFEGYDKNYVPASLQIIYYYRDEAGNDVALYESRFKSSELNFTRDVAANANGIHYKMKPSDSDITKYKVYNGFQLFYVITLLVVIVGLSLLWVIRKVKKLLKTGRVLKVDSVVDEVPEGGAPEDCSEEIENDSEIESE